jgi:ABC-type multidrug transport system ATPase subunit
MKQRFGIAQALIGAPRLIIVDEPTAGLDPAERNRFYNLLGHIGENTIVILSTHIVEDVSTLCSKFAIICDGEVLFVGDPDAAISAMEGRTYAKLIPNESLSQFKEKFNVISSRFKSGKLYITVYGDSSPGPDFIPVQANLEDVYFKIVGSKMSMKDFNF